jgi:hypothetical protein
MGAPQCTLPAFGGGVGVRLASGRRGPTFGRAARSAGALEAWRVQRAISPSVRQAALARSPHVSIVSDRTTGAYLLACLAPARPGRSRNGATPP